MTKSAQQIELEGQCETLMRLIYGKGSVCVMELGPDRPRREWMCTKHDGDGLIGDSEYGYSPEDAIKEMRYVLARTVEYDRLVRVRALAEHTAAAVRLAQEVADTDAILAAIAAEPPEKR